jgi:hypothetical protein
LLVSIGAFPLVVFFSQQLRVTLQTGVVRSTHGAIHRRTQPRDYWLFVGWIITLILVLAAFIPLALLVAFGYLRL